jgi:N-acetyl-gamma-glutamyl-phosphate reductase
MRSKVAIVGVSGYSGLELLRLLASHPSFEVTAAYSDRARGEPLRDLLPLGDPGASSLPIERIVRAQAEAPDSFREADFVALATPAEVSAELAPHLVTHGARVVDLSGAFRLLDQESFRAFYRFEHPHPELLGKVPYGLPQLPNAVGASSIKEAKLVANPGCYATAAILSLAPFLAEGVVEPGGIFVHGKSGVSGAGRKVAENLLFMEVDENVSAYRVGNHQHTPEIEVALSRVAGHPVTLTFAPHLLPLKRGLLTTAFARLVRPLSQEECNAVLLRAYTQASRLDDQQVVEVTSIERASIQSVARTNLARVGVAVDLHNQSIVVGCALDNLLKGAASQALENLLLMAG